MRLVNTKTIELEEFVDGEVPKYAILSHTWGSGEVTLQELLTLEIRTKPGYDKIRNAAHLAQQDGLEYIWVDTCCIDKTSSAELSEAINSMMKYYELSEVCYAYLVDSLPGVAPFEKKCKWFTRGWTLQELIAPSRLQFYASDWSYLDTRERLAKRICKITGIEEYLLQRRSPKDQRGQWPSRQRASDDLRAMLDSISIAERMSWASERQTTRIEDTAYCLMGIFGVNMPLLYGEGDRAFFRLQEEIMKYSDDYSILAWNPPRPNSPHRRRPQDSAELGQCIGILAASPSQFFGCQNVTLLGVGKLVPPFSLTNKGLQIELRIEKSKARETLAILPCQLYDDHTKLLALHLARSPEGIYGRSRERLTLVDKSSWSKWPPTMLYVLSYGAADFGLLKPNESAITAESLSRELRTVSIWCSAVGRKRGSRFIISKDNPAANQLAAVLVSGSQDFIVLLALPNPTGKPHSYLSPVCRLVRLSRLKDKDYWWDSLISLAVPPMQPGSDPNMENLEERLKAWGQKPLGLSNHDWAMLSDQIVIDSKVYFVSIDLEAQLGQNAFNVEINSVPRSFTDILRGEREHGTKRAARAFVRGYLAGGGSRRKIFWLLLLLPRIPTTVLEFFYRLGIDFLARSTPKIDDDMISFGHGLLFLVFPILPPTILHYWGSFLLLLRKGLGFGFRAVGREVFTAFVLYSICRGVVSDGIIDQLRGLKRREKGRVSPPR
jgi:hypothetical protein